MISSSATNEDFSITPPVCVYVHALKPLLKSDQTETDLETPELHNCEQMWFEPVSMRSEND